MPCCKESTQPWVFATIMFNHSGWLLAWQFHAISYLMWRLGRIDTIFDAHKGNALLLQIISNEMSAPATVTPDFVGALPVTPSSKSVQEYFADWHKYFPPVMALMHNQGWLNLAGLSVSEIDRVERVSRGGWERGRQWPKERSVLLLWWAYDFVEGKWIQFKQSGPSFIVTDKQLSKIAARKKRGN